MIATHVIHPVCPAHRHLCDHPQLCDGFCDVTGEQLNTVEAPYTGPSRLHRVLDWVGNYAEAAKTGFFNAFRDAWAVLPSVLVASGVVLACVFAAGVVVGFAK